MTSVRGVTLHQLDLVTESRGTLAAVEVERHVPFPIRRMFMVYDVPAGEVRGQHAHWRCRQFLVCARGTVTLVLDDGTARQEVTLDRPDLGVYVPAMTWGEQHKYSADALLLVFASEHYDASDYIRDHGEFVAAVRR